MINLVIFDMDGVLVNSEPIYVRTNHELYKELGVTITDQEYKSFVGIASDKKWGYIKEKGGLSQTLEELIQVSKIRKYEALGNGEIPLMDGVKDLLERLQQMDLKLALASSNSKKLVELITTYTGIRRFFHAMIDGEQIKNGKPAPDIFLKVAQKLDEQPPNCVVVEDSRNGLLASKAAGMRCIAYNGPAPYPQDFEGADMVIADYSGESIDKIVSFIVGY